MHPITDYRILLPADPKPGEKRAALFLQNAIRIVSGLMLPLCADAEAPMACELCIGRTNRAAADGLDIPALPDGEFEFTLRTVGDRWYFCGHGLPEEEPFPVVSAYRYVSDGTFGTVCAVYRFVEDVLGYAFLHAAPAPTCSALIPPENYANDYTREALRACLPRKQAGTMLYMLPVTARLDWNIMSFVLRTREGKLVVIDGGHMAERDYLVAVLRALSPDPDHIHVEAWLITHLHGDHYGAWLSLLRDEQTADILTVGHVYQHLLDGDYYATVCREKTPTAPALCHELATLPARLGATVHTVQNDDTFTVDELTFRVLHAPDLAYGEQMNTNDTSVVWQLKVTNGATVLFLSDAEAVCNNDLMTRCRDDLPADIVQVGHHGCGNVSEACYRAIGASTYLWPIGHKFWYSDRGDGLGTHNTGVIHTRAVLDSMGIRPCAHIRDDHGISAISLDEGDRT